MQNFTTKYGLLYYIQFFQTSATVVKFSSEKEP